VEYLRPAVEDAMSIPLKPESVRRSNLSRVLLPGLLLLGLWFVLCRQLSGEWSDNEQYSYGWFVPLFALFLFWLRWEEKPEVGGRKSEVGRQKLIAVAIGLAALLLLLPIRLFEIANPDWRPLGWVHTGVVVTMTLLVLWAAGGKAWVRHFAFPVAFFLVAVPWISPIEQPIVQGLMRIVAAVASETITLFGIPAQLEGSLIRVNTGLVGVNEACSGVRSLQTSIMIGLLFGELKRLSVPRRILLVLGALAIALIANFGRAFFLVWIAATQSIPAVDRWHDFAGYSIVAVVFCGSLLLTAILNRNKKVESRKEEVGNEETGKASAPRFLLPTSYFLLSPSYFLLSLLWLVAVEAGAHAWYRGHEKNLTARGSWSVRPPEKAPGFREIKIDDSVRQTLRFDLGREVTWKTIGDATPGFSTTNYLFFFRWNPGSASVLRARAHRPDICLPSIGWQQLADRGAKTYLVRDEIPIVARHITFRQGNGNAVAHTFFCLQEDKTHTEELRPDLQLAEGVQPDWSIKARFRTVRNGIRNLGQQVLEVIFVSPQPMDDQMAEDKFAQLLREAVEPEVGGQKSEVGKHED
jgi:exosortase